MFSSNIFKKLLGSNLRKIIISSLIIILILVVIVILVSYKDKKINYLVYQNLDGLYVEYPDWPEFDVKELEKTYSKEMIEKAKLSIIIMANDKNGAQFIINQRDYLSGTSLEDVIKTWEEDQKKLVPSFKILDKKISGNSVEIKSKFQLSGFDMLVFNKGFLVDIPEQGKRFYNIGITIVKNKLKDYQKIIDHIFNSLRIEKINKKQN